MKLNLYQLCTEDLNVGSIRVFLDGEFRENVVNTLLSLKSNRKLKEISRGLGVDYTTLWDYCNRRSSIPLVVLKKLEKLSGKKFDQSKFQFVCGHQRSKVKLPTKINKSVAKIVGTIIADGHLKIRNSKRGFHYELVIREGYKSNVNAFCLWYEKTFGVKAELKKIENHYQIYVSNKIIVLFLTNIVGLPTGKKSDIISIPEIFRNSNIEIKKAMLQGIFMFNGGVDHATGYVSLTTRSITLVNDVHLFLLDIDLKPDYISETADKFKRWKILFRKENKLTKCLNLFEENTIKHHRLQDHLFGLKEQTNDLSLLCSNLDLHYPRTQKSSITFTDVIKAVEELNQANTQQICKKLKKGSTTVQAYLSKLTKWRILRSRRVGLQKYWELNDTFYIPRR